MGSAKVEFPSSPYAGGEPPTWVTGRSGSSNVTLPFVPDGADSDIVFLRSFFSFFVAFDGTGSSGWLSMVEVLARPGSLTLDFFFVGRVALTSIVGAVVIISGAGIWLGMQLKGKELVHTLRDRRGISISASLHASCNQGQHRYHSSTAKQTTFYVPLVAN